MNRRNEEPKVQIVGPLSNEEGRILWDASTRPDSPQTQAILARVGATMSKDTIAVVEKPVDPGATPEASHYIALDPTDLGTILEPQGIPAGVPPVEVAHQALQASQRTTTKHNIQS